jgi:hypothetical protein
VWRLSTESEPVDGRTDTIAGDLADGGVGEVFVSSFSFSLLSVDDVHLASAAFLLSFYFLSRPFS